MLRQIRPVYVRLSQFRSGWATLGWVRSG